MNTPDYTSLYNSHVHNLKPQNGRQWRGNCPFHEEKTKNNASFSVDIEKGLYNCHSCGAKGNAWKFCKKLNLDPEEYGLIPKKKDAVIDVSKISKYHDYLVSHQENMRNTWDIKIVESLKVGWAPNKETHTFPVYNVDGNPINFKYHRGVQIKGVRATLYPVNLFESFDPSYIVICEGEPDVITLLSNNVQACTSTGGGKKVPNDINHLVKFKIIYLCPDFDEVGDIFLKKWQIRLTQEFPDTCIRFCDLSKFVKEKGDVSDYFLLPDKTKETFETEIMNTAEATLKPFKNFPSGAKEELKSEWFRSLKPFLKIVYTQILARAHEYPLVIPKYNGLRVYAQKGDWIGSAETFASYCGELEGNKITAKKIRCAWKKFEELGKLKVQTLKKGNSVKCTRISLLVGRE